MRYLVAALSVVLGGTILLGLLLYDLGAEWPAYFLILGAVNLACLPGIISIWRNREV